MKILLFSYTLILSISTLSAPIAAHFFFPNTSFIPPWPLNSSKSAWDEFNKLAGCRAGQKVDGLSKLKRYFNRFGYIPNATNLDFTDDFDELLESAIKSYQRNFNLNVTGELDDLTLKQIERPRCGVADIINVSTSVNERKTMEYHRSQSDHFHAVSRYTFFPGEPRWPASKRDLTYAFSPDNDLSDTVKSVFRSAFERWSAVTPLTFTETSSYNTADIEIAFFVGDHGDGEPFDGVLGTLAHAFSPPSGRFHLDNDEIWIVNGDVTTSSQVEAVDLESVAVHEIGHLLGLGHSSVEDSIMYPTISSRTRKIELAEDDITGIQELYGSNPNGNSSSSTPSATEKETSDGRAHILTSPRLLTVPCFIHLLLLILM